MFVHGCFWHQHKDARNPHSRRPARISGPQNSRATRPRDADSRKKLRKIGRRVLVIWECEIRTRDLLAAKLKRFLDKSTLTLIR
ncbi:hypothetical protein XH83_27575 [Bradyrhizobium sp. CCBAU 53351]|nr:hypothetical protein XH83_27575 [Bradyrhizobium sp. CCBAU 53351]